MSNKKELGDMCALIINELFDSTMTSNQYHSERSGSYFFNHKHIQCIEVTNSKGYLDKMGADYKCPIKIKTVRGLRETQTDYKYYLHKAVKNRGGKKVWAVDYGFGEREQDIDGNGWQKLTNREVLHDWELTHHDYFDALTLEMYTYHKLYTPKLARASLVSDPQNDPRINTNIFTDFARKSGWEDVMRRKMSTCFDPADLDHVKASVGVITKQNRITNYSDLPHTSADNIHIYKFYCVYTGQFIFSITLYDFTNFWFPTGEDPRTKTTRGFVAVTVGTNVNSRSNYANNSGESWYDTNEWQIYDKPSTSFPSHNVMTHNTAKHKTKTELIFGSGVNTPIYPKRQSKQTKTYLRGNRYDDFTKSVQGGNTHLHYQRHLVCQIQKLCDLTKPIVDRYLTDSCEYHQLKWNGVEPIHSKNSFVKSEQMYVPPLNPDHHKAVYLMYSKYNAIQVYKENPFTSNPPMPEKVRDLTRQVSASSRAYSEKVKEYIADTKENPFESMTHSLHEYAIDPNVISEKAVDGYNKLKLDKHILDEVKQEYTAKVCITVNPVTGQVYTGDSFNFDKHRQYFARNCFFSRGDIFQLYRYFLKGIQEVLSNPPTEQLDIVRDAFNHVTKYTDLTLVDLGYLPEQLATYLYLTETCNLYNTYNSIEQFAELHADWYGTMCMLDYAMPDETNDKKEEITHCVPYVGSKIVVSKPYKHWTMESLTDIALRDHFGKSYYYIYKKEGEVE